MTVPEPGSWDEPRLPTTRDVSWSLDGTLLVANRRMVWNIDEGTHWEVDLPVGAMAAPSADGTVVVAADALGIAVFDAADGRRLDSVAPTPLPFHAVLGPAGEIAAAFDDGTAETWDADGRSLARWTWEAYHLTWSADGVCGRGPRGLSCFDPHSGTEILNRPLPREHLAAGPRDVRYGGRRLLVDEREIELPEQARVGGLIPSADGRTVRIDRNFVVDLDAGTVSNIPWTEWDEHPAGQRGFGWGDSRPSITSVRAGRYATLERDGAIVVRRVPTGP